MKKSPLKSLFKAIRVHQWAKNILLFVPLITAHQLSSTSMILRNLAAFFAFSLCASGVYLLNDLVDLENDRLHPTKQHRPFASGALSVSFGKIAIPIFLVGGFGIAFTLPEGFRILLCLYFLGTLAYSLRLKRIPLVDVMVLTSLYTIRVFAGATAVDVPVSPWLLAFSMFFFLSLAFVKRYSELHLLQVQSSEYGKGRGYMGKDLGLISELGIASGYISVLVMALYVNSGDIPTFYQHPKILWLICPILLYWISRVWLITRRGQMHDDPIVFAIKDKVSYLVGALAGLMIILAT